jgi:hypothetical protein
LKKIIFIFASIICNACSSKAYSVLTHEAIIDAAWNISVKPLLKQKFPNATEKQLKEAHAYAYGGAVAPDMGYFPFGSRLFTNLIHYVRSGDFTNVLFDEAQDINEYAFALGMLSHYNADNYGHPLGVNICVPIVYPKDKEKFGDTVTYEQDKTAHLKMEFGFDVLQTARGNYASQAYHDFIGFKVSKPVLERAFLKTYGLKLEDIFVNFDVAVGTFRWTVKNLFPDITRVAWSLKKNEILQSNPDATSRRFIYKMSRHSYYKAFGKKRTRPGFSASVLAFIIRIVPKAGPLKALHFKAPSPEAEKLFVQSFDTVLAHYIVYTKNLRYGNLHLPDIDYDTGNKTMPGEYELADENYGTLLLMLSNDNFSHVTPSLKQNILAYYNAFDTTKNGSGLLKDISNALEKLKTSGTINKNE